MGQRQVAAGAASASPTGSRSVREGKGQEIIRFGVRAGRGGPRGWERKEGVEGKVRVGHVTEVGVKEGWFRVGGPARCLRDKPHRKPLPLRPPPPPRSSHRLHHSLPPCRSSSASPVTKSPALPRQSSGSVVVAAASKQNKGGLHAGIVPSGSPFPPPWRHNV